MSDEYYMMIEDFSIIYDYLREARKCLEEDKIGEALKLIEEAIYIVSKWV